MSGKTLFADKEYEEEMNYCTVLFKNGNKETHKQFLDAFTDKCYEAEADSEHSHEITHSDPSRVDIEISSDGHNIADKADMVLKELQLWALRVYIYSQFDSTWEG